MTTTPGGEDLNVKNYLSRKKWSFKTNATQHVVKTCPLCGDRGDHFYINRSSGQFLCWKCDEKGNLYELKKKLGDLKIAERLTSKTAKPKISKDRYETLQRKVRGWHNALLSSKKVRKRLKKKYGYNQKVIDDFKLGLCKKYGKLWISIPYYEGSPAKPTLVGLKYRTVPPAPKKFRREEGLKSSLYNVHNLDFNLDFVFLFEGESDTATAHSLLQIPNVLGVTVGAKGFKEEWLDVLDQFARVYLVYDNDIVGQKGAETVARRIGLNKTYSIVLPTNESGASIDFNEWYKQGHNKDEFEELMLSADLFQVKDVTKLKSVLQDLEAQYYFNKSLDSTALKTPWISLNNKLGGFFPGDLIVLSGRAKVGKTTFALNIAGHYILENIPSMIYCLEMREERLARKFVQWYRGVESNMMTVEDIIVTEQMLSSKPLYFANSHSFTSDEIYDTIRESVRRYGLEFVIFDHLHFMVRAENDKSNVSAQVSATVRNFKLLAEELRIPIMLVCQPRKLTGPNTKMTVDDLRDSSSIGQDADTVIIVHRDRVKNAYQNKVQKYDDGAEDEDEQKIHENRTQIIVDATRYNPGGMTSLWYNGAISRYFKDREEERKFLQHGFET